MENDNRIIDFTEKWVKLTNKEIVKEYGIKEDIKQGDIGGYQTSDRLKVINEEVYMKKEIYDKENKKRSIKKNDKKRN
jgi:hypothetical protein